MTTDRGAAPVASDPEVLLRAGALLPADAPVRAERISARTYEHPALGERRVVRLVAEPIGEAEDLALQTLDFRLAGSTTPVALGRPRGLGFPATAILADPANASFALGVVKEMERYARMAKGKPGNAKDGFDAIATRLAASVPHFLPSFHEQAGRAFLDAGALAQAAASFGRAREAERAYGLKVDEAQRRQAFLEFALAGALTAKSLSEYARDLVTSAPPGEAHAALKELCVQRTLGGLPPWTAMAAELRRTAKAAGLDPAAEEAEVLADLLDAPATMRAAPGFWTGYRAALLRAAKADPAFRGKLLGLHPTPPDGRDAFTDWWIELLEESGAAQGLIDPSSVPEVARASSGVATWLEQTARQAQARWYWRAAEQPMSRFHGLIARIGPAVIAEGRPVDVSAGWRTDVELMDVILAAGIPVAPPQVATAANGYQAPAFDLHRYADRAQRRPLIALGASKDLEGAVDAAVDRAILQAPGKLAELPGLHPALRRWLERQTASAVEGTLASLDQAVIVLEKGASPSVLALAPDIAKRLGDIDVAHVLWQTLRGGLVAELAWPGLEANRDLDLGHVTLAGTAWPALLVSDGKKAAAIDATGTRLVHDLRYPPNQASWARAPLVLANGQLFVGWRFPKTEGYWSGRPNDVFEPDGSLIEAARPMGGAETSLELPDGSRFQGGAPIRAGDRRAAAARPVVSDGETVWVLTESGTLREAELETGKTGRVSRPSFFEDFAAEGWELDLSSSWLMPVPPGTDGGPLGSRDGLIGLRVRSRVVDGRTEWDVEGIDGRRWRGTFGADGGVQMPGGPRPVALVLMPGDPAPRPLTRDAFGNRLRLWDAQGRYALAEMAPGSPLDVPTAFQQANTRSPGKPLLDGMPFVPPPIFWALLVPRQPAGSSALRSLDAAAVKRLLDAALADLPTPPQLGGRPQMPQAEKALAAVLPAVTEPRLRQAVLGALMLAARLVRQLEGLERRPDSPTVAAAAARRVPAVAPTEASPNAPVTVASPVAIARVIDDAALGRALVGLAPGGSYQFAFGGGGTGRPLEQLAAVATAMGSAKGARTSWRDTVGALFGTAAPASAKPASLPSSGIAWYSFIGRMGALALRAAMPTTNDDERAALVALLEALVTNGFPARRRETRLLTITRPRSGQVMPGVRLEWIGDHVLFVRQSYWTSQGAQLTGFEYAPGGRFELPKDATLIDEERPGEGWGDAATVSRFLELLAARGPVPWDPAAVDRLQRDTGLARAAAALLLATLPAIDDRSHNFLRNEVRAILDVKVADAKAARDLLQALPHARRLTLLDSAMPADPEALWRDGLSGVAERLAAAWVASQGRRATVDDATLAAASKALAFQGSPTDPMRLLADPTDTRLTTEPPILMARGWTSEDPKAERFSAAIVRTLAIGIPWLHGAVQVGDATLARLPEVLDVARQRLASPSLVLPMGWVQWPDFANSLQALGARRWSPPRGAQVEGEVMELGPYLDALARERRHDQGAGSGRRHCPAGPGADPVYPLFARHGSAPVHGARFLLGPDAIAIAERAAASPLPPGAFEADPAASSPGTVAAAAEALGVPPEAARLFLQLLALPAPTKAAVQRWNGWDGKAWTAASQALVDAGHVVTGQRSRAGRDVFLTGAWVELFGARPPGRDLEAAAVRRHAGRGRHGDDAAGPAGAPRAAPSPVRAGVDALVIG